MEEEDNISLKGITESMNKLLDRTKLTKHEFMGILIIISLIVLLIGVTVRYNALVKDFNSLVEEVNDCRAKGYSIGGTTRDFPSLDYSNMMGVSYDT